MGEVDDYLTRVFTATNWAIGADEDFDGLDAIICPKDVINNVPGAPYQETF